jgi:hypothetical protein
MTTETIFLTSFSTPFKLFLPEGSVWVTPTTAKLGVVLDVFLAYASKRDPRVGVYECINWSGSRLACKGNPVKAPVGSHQSLPLKTPY